MVRTRTAHTAHKACIGCVQGAHTDCTYCAESVHGLCTRCAHRMHNLCTQCAQPVHTVRTRTARLVHNLRTPCAQPVHTLCATRTRIRVWRFSIDFQYMFDRFGTDLQYIFYKSLGYLGGVLGIGCESALTGSWVRRVFRIGFVPTESYTVGWVRRVHSYRVLGSSSPSSWVRVHRVFGSGFDESTPTGWVR